MAAVVPENIRRLLTKYAFETDAESMGEDLTCTLCNKLMIDAYQSGCGCKYCRECVVGYLSEGNSYCRGGKKDCQDDPLVLEDTVCRSVHLNKRIMKVRVHCPNKPCVFISPLTEMDYHLRVCGQQPLECPYTTIGGEGASKDKMETNLSNETMAHSRLLMEEINNLRDELGGVREGLKLSQLEVASVREKLRMSETARRGDLDHLKEERAQMRAQMEKRQRVLEEEKAQMDERQRVLEVWLEAQASAIRELKMTVERDQLEVQELQSQYEVHESILKGGVDAVREISKDTKAKLESLKATGRAWQDTNVDGMDALRAEIGALRAEMTPEGETSLIIFDEDEERAASTVTGERRRVDELARTVGPLNAGTNLVVAVGRPRFTVDQLGARVVEGEEVWSPHFYSHTNGYKLRLRLHPGGDGDGAKTHVSVYVVLCRGEYDAVLPWPCTHAVTVSLVNQLIAEVHVTETLSCCDINKNGFSKPIDTDNSPYGWPSFVSHDVLQSTEGLVVNDSVLLLVVVAPPPVEVVAFTVDRWAARVEKGEAVWSPHFYSHTNGYKLRVEVHPGGCVGSGGTRVSVFSVVCRGEDDNTLVWPCRYGVAISLVNQLSNEAHDTMTLTHCTDSEPCFNKPISTDNIPYGSPFVSHADVDAIEGLVVNQRTNEAHDTMTLTHCTDFEPCFNKPISTDNIPYGSPFVSHADLDAIEGLVVNDSVLFRVALVAPQLPTSILPQVTD